MTFEEALTALKNNDAVSREGWNGKGMFLMLETGLEDPVILPHINMYIPTDRGPEYCQIVPWVASHTDLLADDWKLGES